MAFKHAHAEATYRVVQLRDMSYGVEVSVPDQRPTTVTSFATEADAEAWIDDHKMKIALPPKGTGWGRKFANSR